MLKSWNSFCMTWHWFVNVLLDSIYWVRRRIFALAFKFLKQTKLFSASVPGPVGPSAKTFFSWSLSSWFFLSVQFLVQGSSSLLSLRVFTYFSYSYPVLKHSCFIFLRARITIKPSPSSPFPVLPSPFPPSFLLPSLLSLFSVFSKTM